MLIGLDIGRNSVKVCCGDGRFSFPSKIGEWRERRLTSGGNYELEYNGQKYFVGELAEESYCQREMATESKIHNETKLLFLTALGIVNKPDFNVTIGLPVIQHVPIIKEQFNSFLIGKYSYKLNGESRNINISNIGIVPESAGVYWSEVLNYDGKIVRKDLANGLVRILDIGSRTINYCSIKDKKYIDKDSGTLNYGCYEIENSKAPLGQFARKIVADMSKIWLNQAKIIIAGGGAPLLHEYFMEHWPDCQIAEDPVFANAKGFYKMGVARYGKGN